MVEDPKKLPEPPLPLNHPNWIPLVNVHALLTKQRTGSPHIAAHDLRRALAGGTIRCTMIRIADPSKVGWVKPAFWVEHELYWSDGRLCVCKPRLFSDNVVQRIALPWEFFVWKPDVTAKAEAEPEPEYIRKAREQYPRGVPRGKIKAAYRDCVKNPDDFSYSQFYHALDKHNLLCK
jgi:hypothetical protein